MDKPLVLIVEGEALIRLSAVHIIEDAGYAALEACNADEAVVLLEGRGDIRAVFTDIRMSGSMDGLKLAHAIRGRWPPIHLLVTSGADLPDDLKLPEKGRFIRKPYDAEQITAVLREFFGVDPGSGRFRTNTHQKSGKIA
jgi:CheY-like chemotaxis protein